MNEQTRKRLLKMVHDNYQAIAEDFSQSRERSLWPEIIKLINQYLPQETEAKLMDIGCGNGRLLDNLPDNTNYLGVDISANLINIASSYNRRQQQVAFATCDILELNQLPQNNFDIITAIAILHHLPGQTLRRDALKQLKNKLNDRGVIILSVWNLWSKSRYRRTIWRFWLLKLIKKHHMDFGDILLSWQNKNTPHYQRYYHAFTKRQLIKLVKLSGLKLVSLSKDQNNYYLVLKKA
ncbi:hypothetical protein COT94_02480 [Candidatus Falkowbacteria bacterium CG10_big_fil_rev_8_21_14_0_10_37_14]|uniref:Methyltransferase domain-containing protein n=1 Tax=Candidatus Falkowbacteria bacterium CG10_big_fil_rev_8_21_14_0_10_37_14 TaxID=1974561 RepID=A0A2M6WTI8_9BACT|nr:class I SAM-dependent methyltransferase [Candidatus Falkowbacteria bacterium]PIT96102.1 MAG: hypothetical protein COT94_02480 [Candidatus Falkowbacteria bacterium CG10_big_fil_rev_8_21_14_0_10_37_14]